MVTDFSEMELKFFHENGYVVKKNFLDVDHCREVVGIAWEYLPKSFDFKDRKTWKGEVTCSCCVTQNLNKRRGHVRIRKESIAVYPRAQKLVAKNPKIIAAVSQLVGAPLAPAIFRGLYFTFPIPKLFSIPHKGHLESHPFQVGVVAYCSDVNRNGGGLNVWPGSHWAFQEAFTKKLGFHANEKYKSLAKYFNSIKPLAIEGGIGDVIFTHHKLFHAPSNNNLDIPRSAFFCDFRAKNWVDLEAQESSGHPFETFGCLRQYDRADTKKLSTVYDNRPEALRVLTERFPFLSRFHNRLVGNASTVARSKVAYDARFKQ